LQASVSARLISDHQPRTETPKMRLLKTAILPNTSQLLLLLFFVGASSSPALGAVNTTTRSGSGGGGKPKAKATTGKKYNTFV
jgi:hypothetical protein